MAKTKHYGKRYKAEEEKAMQHAGTFLPPSLLQKIKKVAAERDIPAARIIAFAVDNEITESNVPFNYPCEMPSSPYVEYAYAEEAGRLMRFIQRFESNPMTLNQLMLCRRDIGIPSREVLMLAYRELLEKKMVEEYLPREAKYEKQTKRIRPVQDESIEKKRYRSRPEILDAEGEENEQ